MLKLNLLDYPLHGQLIKQGLNRTLLNSLCPRLFMIPPLFPKEAENFQHMLGMGVGRFL